ncbi:MAG: glycosyltransferase, partial [Candidatus Babeliales bacterium]
MLLINKYQKNYAILQRNLLFFACCLIINLTMQSENITETNKEKRPLKILVVVSFFPPQSGTAVLNQITGLIDRGHDVWIYSKKRGNLELSHPDMIKYNLLERSYFHSDLKRKLDNLPPDLSTFDIIYCQFGYRGNEFLKEKENQQLKAKLITCFRGADLSKHVKTNPHKYDLLLQKGDLFLPVCKAFKNRLISLGAHPEKIIVHPSAIDCKKFSFKPRTLEAGETIKIVTVCRLIEKKGLVYAIHAIERLVRKNKNVTYDIIGFGPMEQELETLIQRLGIQNNIHLVGRASEDEVAEILD